ncbi:MAG: protein-glutamate O-methyltransferase CheR [Desulfuromonadales bacterium]|nr:protein-glutamate O-methyltransferase CheR [Desulfuromonadales bacterium]
MNSESIDNAMPLIGDELPDAIFEAIIELLRTRRQFDLGAYKDRCIRRRIAKRLRNSGASDVAGYLKLLTDDEGELDALLATLSIHVSQFFRNSDTFLALERHVLPDLFRLARATGRRELRLWSVGCAGGEEPYSLALLIDELSPAGLKVDILATDVSEPVLESARAALYEPVRLTEVPPPVLARYFTAEGDRYRLIEKVRALVRFERHNVMTAAEFPPADLILCRNVLIYFTREEQARILARFAAALPEGGALVLGRAEALTGVERQLFRTEFPTERIYRRMAAAAPGADS